uniref:Uncharacterized protein n=1 Tax=Arundo donax TaxID=35708 RepID=A0A0A8ZR47_ARUDO
MHIASGRTWHLYVPTIVQAHIEEGERNPQALHPLLRFDARMHLVIYISGSSKKEAAYFASLLQDV